MICPITDKPCRTNGCGEKCYKRDSLGYSTAPQHDAKLPVIRRSEQLPCDHLWKSRFTEKRGSYVICAKCSEER